MCHGAARSATVSPAQELDLSNPAVRMRFTLESVSHALRLNDEATSVIDWWDKPLQLLLKATTDELNACADLWLLDDHRNEPALVRWYNEYRAGFCEVQYPEPIPVSTEVVSDRLLGRRAQPDLAAALGFESSRYLLVPVLGKVFPERKCTQLVGVIALSLPQADRDPLLETDENYSSLISFGRLVGTWWTLHRRMRVSRAVEVFQKRIEGLSDPDEICRRAAEVLVEKVAAEIGCAIYRQGVGGDLVRVAWHAPKLSFAEASSSGAPATSVAGALTQQIHGGDAHSGSAVVRVRDVSDQDELRFALGGTGHSDLHDTEGVVLNSPLALMAMRVTCPSANPTGWAPLLTIKLLARRGPKFTGGAFSRTNRDILERIGLYLRDVIPGLLVRESMAEIARTILEETKRRQPRVTSEAHDVDMRLYERLAVRAVHSIKECYVVDRGRLRRLSSDSRASTLGGHIPLHQLDFSRHGIVQQLPNGSYAVVWHVLERADRSVSLVCRCHSNSVPEHDAIILERIAAELHRALVQDFDPAEWTTQLSEVRHSLRNIISAVRNQVDSISQSYESVSDLAPEEVYDQLVRQARFRKDMKRLKLSVQDLLALFESNRLLLSDMTRERMQRTSVDLSQLLRDAILLCRPESERRDITVILQNGFPRDLKVDADRVLMQLLIFNLLDNAIKYSDQEETVVIRTWISHRHWVLSIRNIGQFLDPAQISKAFEPFRRLTPARGRQQMSGTGLGLPAVDKILQLHNSPGTPRREYIKIESTALERERGDQLRGEVIRAKTTINVSCPIRLTVA